MSELKPCPFCGGKAETRKAFGFYAVGCDKCNATTDFMSKTTEHADNVWNTRAEPEPFSERATLFMEFDDGKSAKRFARMIQKQCPAFAGWHVNPASIMSARIADERGQAALELLHKMVERREGDKMWYWGAECERLHTEAKALLKDGE